MAKIVPYNLLAFPPSMAVIVRGVSMDAEESAGTFSGSISIIHSC